MPDQSMAAQIEELLAEHDARRATAAGEDDERMREVWTKLGDLGFRSPEHARENLAAIREAERRRAKE